jgi:hypothetical protein
MDRKSKILLTVFLLLLIGTISVTVYMYGVKKDYLVSAQASCDPSTESCFYLPCAEGDDTCDPANVEYYKKVEKKASNLELCDPAVEGCNPLVCTDGEKGCTVTYCSADTLDEGEKCLSLSTPIYQ